MWALNTCGEPNEVELTIRALAGYFTALCRGQVPKLAPLTQCRSSARLGSRVMLPRYVARLHVVVSPGIYHLDAPLSLATSGQVILGLGLATLVSAAATPVVSVADGVDDVRVAGLLLQVRLANSRVQFHPHGGQFDFVWLSARTPHGAYVW